GAAGRISLRARAVADVSRRAADQITDERLPKEPAGLDVAVPHTKAGVERERPLGLEVGVLVLKPGAGLLAAGQVVEVRRAKALIEVEVPGQPVGRDDHQPGVA